MRRDSPSSNWRDSRAGPSSCATVIYVAPKRRNACDPSPVGIIVGTPTVSKGRSLSREYEMMRKQSNELESVAILRKTNCHKPLLAIERPRRIPLAGIRATGDDHSGKRKPTNQTALARGRAARDDDAHNLLLQLCLCNAVRRNYVLDTVFNRKL